MPALPFDKGFATRPAGRRIRPMDTGWYVAILYHEIFLAPTATPIRAYCHSS